MIELTISLPESAQDLLQFMEPIRDQQERSAILHEWLEKQQVVIEAK